MRLIYKQGGPAALIAADPGNFVRRFFVELLATTDVFSESHVRDYAQMLIDQVPSLPAKNLCCSGHGRHGGSTVRSIIRQVSSGKRMSDSTVSAGA